MLVFCLDDQSIRFTSESDVDPSASFRTHSSIKINENTCRDGEIRVRMIPLVFENKFLKNLFRTAKNSSQTSRNLPVLTQINPSPFGFLTALLRLTKIIYQIDKSLASSVSIKQSFHISFEHSSSVAIYHSINAHKSQ